MPVLTNSQDMKIDLSKLLYLIKTQRVVWSDVFEFCINFTSQRYSYAIVCMIIFKCSVSLIFRVIAIYNSHSVNDLFMDNS